MNDHGVNSDSFSKCYNLGYDSTVYDNFFSKTVKFDSFSTVTKYLVRDGRWTWKFGYS